MEWSITLSPNTFLRQTFRTTSKSRYNTILFFFFSSIETLLCIIWNEHMNISAVIWFGDVKVYRGDQIVSINH